jgi:ribosomal protein L37AE/L43A
MERREILMPEETKPVCPKCGSNLVIQIANGKHCNQCGLDFDIEKSHVRKILAYKWGSGAAPGHTKPPKPA